MTNLFDPITLRDLEIPNRLWVSPMCMYSASNEPGKAGRPTDFHYAHLAARAAGGAGLVVIEATAVTPEGRITPFDLGLWEDDQIPDFTHLVQGIRDGGALPGIQLAHAGRKASTQAPWDGPGSVSLEDGGWQTLAPSEVAFPGYAAPHALSIEQIKETVQDFARAAVRARQAGFDVVEIHAAHGYLLHQFLSPLSNQRTDEYGGSFENRVRLTLEVIDAVRETWPAELPVFLRVSMTDWIEEKNDGEGPAWTLEQTIALAKLAAEHGVDLIDCSSGGAVPAPVPNTVDYQTALAAKVKAAVDIAVAAVGRITEAEQANQLIEKGEADAIFVARAFLTDPSFANHAARALGREPRYLKQYGYRVR